VRCRRCRTAKQERRSSCALYSNGSARKPSAPPSPPSCIIDGEAVACDDNGIASFELIRHHHANDGAFLYAFDLIELNGDDVLNHYRQRNSVEADETAPPTRAGETQSSKSPD
jgi:hypothetical protein